jgi:hypothetical protein
MTGGENGVKIYNTVTQTSDLIGSFLDIKDFAKNTAELSSMKIVNSIDQIKSIYKTLSFYSTLYKIYETGNNVINSIKNVLRVPWPSNNFSDIGYGNESSGDGGGGGAGWGSPPSQDK